MISFIRSAGFMTAVVLACAMQSAPALSSEKVKIPTFTPGDYSEILSGAYKARTDRISGKLSFPANRSGPVPAVVIMHGSGGIRTDTEWAVSDALNDAGIATLVVDSFKGRGLSETGSDQGRLPIAATVTDGFAALLALRQEPEIDGTRIGITGFSRGGVAALFSNQKTLAAALLGPAPGFAAHAPVYPGCSTQWDQVEPTGAPVLFLLGRDDDLTPARKCEIYAQRINEAGGHAKTVIYPNASHQFLVPKQRRVRNVPNFADCDLGITPGGEMHYPKLGISVDGNWKGFVKKVVKDCGKDGFTQGGTAKSHSDAIADLVAFFRTSLDVQ